MPKLQKLKNGSYVISIPMKIITSMGWEKGEYIEMETFRNENHPDEPEVILYTLKRHSKIEVKNV